MNKGLILNAIKSHYGFRTNAQFGDFLGVASQTISSWYSRNTFDIELLYAKCTGIDGNWLLSGQGDMFRNSSKHDEKISILEIKIEMLEKILKDKDEQIAEQYNTIQTLQSLIRANLKKEEI